MRTPNVPKYPALVMPDGGWPLNGRMATTAHSATQVQTELKRLKWYGGDIDGSYGPASSVADSKFQQQRWLDIDGIHGLTTDGMLFPPAGAEFGVDFSFTQEWTAEELADRGVQFVLRYLFPLTFGGGKHGKGISRAEYDSYIANNIMVPAFLHETDPTDPIFTYERGILHAKEAEYHRILNNLPPLPIIFNYDTDMAIADIPQLLEGLRGASTVVGLDRTWLYGEYDAVKAAFDAGRITQAFQTYGWSRGLWEERAQYRQWSNGQWGDTVDFDWKMFI